MQIGECCLTELGADLMRKILLASAAIVGVLGIVNSASAMAADSQTLGALPSAVDPFVARPSSLPPVLQILEANNIKITALTPVVGNLHGYLLEDPAGKMQVIYISADGQAFVAGVEQAIGPDGKNLINVTTLQFSELKHRFDAARQGVDDQQQLADAAKQRVADQQRLADEARQEVIAQQQLADADRAKADAAAAALLAQQSLLSSAAKQNLTMGSTALELPGTGTPAAPVSTPAPAPAPAPTPTVAAQSSAPAIAPDPVPAVSSTPLATSPGPQASDTPSAPAAPQGDVLASYLTPYAAKPFTNTMESSNYIAFSFGHKASHAVYMVADPQCPHCRNVWDQLVPLAHAGVLSINLIVVGVLPGSDVLASSIFGHSNPGALWVDAENGKQLPPAPLPGTKAALDAADYIAGNFQLLGVNNDATTPWPTYVSKKDGQTYLRLHVTGVPWLAYVGKDGKVYMRSGDGDLTAFLNGL
jgi:hypothetical protein